MNWARWVIEQWPSYPKVVPPFLYVGNRIVSHGCPPRSNTLESVPFKRQFFPTGEVYVWVLEAPCWAYQTHYQGLSDRPQESELPDPILSAATSMGFTDQPSKTRLVYCMACSKTHAVKDDNEEECSPGAWIENYA